MDNKRTPNDSNADTVTGVFNATVSTVRPLLTHLASLHRLRTMLGG